MVKKAGKKNDSEQITESELLVGKYINPEDRGKPRVRAEQTLKKNRCMRIPEGRTRS